MQKNRLTKRQICWTEKRGWKEVAEKKNYLNKQLESILVIIANEIAEFTRKQSIKIGDKTEIQVDIFTIVKIVQNNY